MHASLFLFSAVLLAACPGAGGENVPGCEGLACASGCEEGALACRGSVRAAICREGTWQERHCDVACVEGRCVDCLEGTRRCAGEATAEVCVDGQFVPQPCPDGVCLEGECRCDADATRCAPLGRERCGAEGRFALDPCPRERPLCRGGSCLQCEPGRPRCLGPELSQLCSPDGDAELVTCPSGCDSATGSCREQCTPDELRCRGRVAVQRCDGGGGHFADIERCNRGAGEVCSEGDCVSSCWLAAEAEAPSGCRFYAAQALALESPDHFANFAVSRNVLNVINPDPESTVSVELRQGAMTRRADIPPRASVELDVNLWKTSSEASLRLSDGAVRISSNLPVFVVQHLFLHEGFGEAAKSGDTAFLLPYHLLESYGRRHRVITQPHRWNHANIAQPGGFTVVSTLDEPGATTTLDVDWFGTTAASQDGQLASQPFGSHRTLELGAGEAIQFLSEAPGSVCEGSGCASTPGDDLSGTLIASEDPVAIFNGGMSRVPWCAGCHSQTQLLEQIMPIALWGEDYSLAARNVPRADATPAGQEQWVFLTDQADNELTFDPLPPTLVATRPLLNSGDRLVFNTEDSAFAGYRNFAVRSKPDKPILVARYFYTGSSLATHEGGSTFTFERPKAFWRSKYFFRSLGREHNRVLVIVPTGGAVRRGDGSPLGSARSGPPGHDVVEVPVDVGLHALTSDAPFGLLVYGYSHYENGSVEALDGRIAPFHSYTYAGPVGFGDALVE